MSQSKKLSILNVKQIIRATLLIFLLASASANALNIGDYKQTTKGKAAGTVSITGLRMAVELYVQAIAGEQDLKLNLVQVGNNRVDVIITDDRPFPQGTFINIIAQTKKNRIARVFPLNSNIVKQPEPIVPPSEVAPQQDTAQEPETPPSTVQKEPLKLEKIEDITDDEMLTILITGGRAAMTVREGIEYLLADKDMELMELPGDAKLLDSIINTTIPLASLEDLHYASNGNVGHIIIDKSLNKIRLVSSSVVLPKNNVISGAPAAVPEPVDKVEPPRTSVRDLVSAFAIENGKTLIELPGDSAVLDLMVEADRIEELGELSILSNQAVGGILLDSATNTIRALSKTLVSVEPPKPSKRVRDLVIEYATAGGFSLAELPGDSRVLDQRTENTAGLTDWTDLYKLEDVQIRNVYIDHATKTIRVI